MPLAVWAQHSFGVSQDGAGLGLCSAELLLLTAPLCTAV